MKETKQHYFMVDPVDSNSRDCALCGKYFTDEVHIRAKGDLEQLGYEFHKLKMIIIFHTLFGKFLNYLVEKLDNLTKIK